VFTEQQFPELKRGVDVFILAPSRDFKTSLAKMVKDKPQEFSDWFDTTMANFLPVIPGSTTNDGQISRVPAVLINPIEATPRKYKQLIDLVAKVNRRFTFFGQIPIKNVVKYWQFTPRDMQEAILEYATGGIRPNSANFNRLFVQQYKMTREFIIDDILGSYLKIKRASNDFEEWHDAPIEIEEEMEKYDDKIQFMLVRETDKDEWTAIFQEFKSELCFWFDKKNAVECWNEFKEVIGGVLDKELAATGFQQFLKVSKESNSEEGLGKDWLKLYEDGKALFCMWPTIYGVAGVLHGGEKDGVLEGMERDLLLHVHMSIPESRGVVLPPRKSL
jgi:hypothetical protein